MTPKKVIDSINRLPSGWISIKFENVKPHTQSFDPVTEKNQKYIGLEHIEKNTGQITGYSNSNTTLSTKTVFSKGDLLYGKLRPYLNKVAIAEFDGVCSTDILVFTKNPVIVNSFLKFCLLKSDFVQFANNTVTGVQHPRTSHKKLSNYNIPIPPLLEQHRIVAKIESIFAQIDACKARLMELQDKVQTGSTSLAALKSSVLKQAFEGKLVRQDSRDDSAETLLKKSHNDLKINSTSKNLPKGWISISLQYVRPSTIGFDPTKEENQRYIGLEHIEKNTGRIIGSADSKTTVSSKTVFKKGDLLYGKLRPYLNKVAIPDFDGVCSTDILVFPKNPFITNTLLKFCLLKSDFVRFANSTITGVQHPRTSHKKLSEYLIPIPPLKEQRRIVSKIESIFAKIDATDKLVKDSLVRLDLLKKSVLRQAFIGKLVPQDPNDEPVSVLLEKLNKRS